MARKALLTVLEEHVAPRFDLATEVVIARFGDEGAAGGERIIVLPHASAEDLCHLIVTEGVTDVVCGGIEEEYHQYLGWKRVRVFDSVMGPWRRALEELVAGRLLPEAVLHPGAGEAVDG